MENVCRWELLGVVGLWLWLSGYNIVARICHQPHNIYVNVYQLIALPQQRIFHLESRHSQPPRPLLLHRSGEPQPSKDIFVKTVNQLNTNILLSLENWCWCCPISLAVAGCGSQFVCICRAIEVTNNKSIKLKVHLSDPSAQGFSASQRFFSCRKSFKYNISLREQIRLPRRKSSWRLRQSWKSDSDSIPFRLRQNLEKINSQIMTTWERSSRHCSIFWAQRCHPGLSPSSSASSHWTSRWLWCEPRSCPPSASPSWRWSSSWLAIWGETWDVKCVIKMKTLSWWWLVNDCDAPLCSPPTLNWVQQQWALSPQWDHQQGAV